MKKLDPSRCTQCDKLIYRKADRGIILEKECLCIEYDIKKERTKITKKVQCGHCGVITTQFITDVPTNEIPLCDKCDESNRHENMITITKYKDNYYHWLFTNILLTLGLWLLYHYQQSSIHTHEILFLMLIIMWFGFVLAKYAPTNRVCSNMEGKIK